MKTALEVVKSSLVKIIMITELQVMGPPPGSDVKLWLHSQPWKLKESLEVNPAVDHQTKRTTIH